MYFRDEKREECDTLENGSSVPNLLHLLRCDTPVVRMSEEDGHGRRREMPVANRLLTHGAAHGGMSQHEGAPKDQQTHRIKDAATHDTTGRYSAGGIPASAPSTHHVATGPVSSFLVVLEKSAHYNVRTRHTSSKEPT
jgi:hypothetical protein